MTDRFESVMGDRRGSGREDPLPSGPSYAPTETSEFTLTGQEPRMVKVDYHGRVKLTDRGDVGQWNLQLVLLRPGEQPAGANSGDWMDVQPGDELGLYFEGPPARSFPGKLHVEHLSRGRA